MVAVDLNRIQNLLTDLKAAAVATLEPDEAIAFLGGAPMSESDRRDCYERVAPALGRAAQGLVERPSRPIAKGVLNVGVTERFIGGVMTTVKKAIHPPERIARLLACQTLDEQREFYRQEWDTVRWRLLFTLLLNRAVFRKTYHPGFFEHVENPSFARHFRALAEHSLTEVPIATNYFVHHMLTGSYPVDVPGGVPPYLAPEGAAVVAPPPTSSPSSTGATRRTCAPAPTPASTASPSPTSSSGSRPSRPTSCSPRSCAPPSPAPGSCSATSWAGPRCPSAGATWWSRTGPWARPSSSGTGARCSGASPSAG